MSIWIYRKQIEPSLSAFLKDLFGNGADFVPIFFNYVAYLKLSKPAFHFQQNCGVS